MKITEPTGTSERFREDISILEPILLDSGQWNRWF